jgi:hypothetical protein
MSQHPNADGSITDGVKVEAWGKFVSHQIGLSVAAVAQLTVLAGCNQAVVQADGGATLTAVRFTLDGTTPTTTSGFVIPAGSSITLSASDAANAKFISTSTTVGTINVVSQPPAPERPKPVMLNVAPIFTVYGAHCAAAENSVWVV